MDLETYIKTTKGPTQKLMERYAEVAGQVGTSTIHLHNIARGHTRPGTGMVMRILAACPGVTFEELVGMNSHCAKSPGEPSIQK